MLLAIQFPLADSRSFLQSPNRVTKPVWPIPNPDSEFVRYFGPIRERKAGGIVGWGSENENVVCEADRALSFRTDLTFIDPSEQLHLILRRAFSRFYFDSYAVGKLEVGLTTKKHSKVVVTQKQTRNVVNHFLHLPVQVSNPLGSPSNCDLVRAGRDIARLYLIATTYNEFRGSISSQKWQIQSGAPLLFLEYTNNESIEIPFGARPISLAEQYDLRLFRYAIPYEGGRTNMWILGCSATTQPEIVRTLRLYLLRLHAEHECLRLILRNVELEYIITTRETKESENLQDYFNRTIKRIKRLEARAEQHFTTEIADIARNATDLLKSDISTTLLATVEKLNMRRNIFRKVKDYIETVGVVPQTIQIVEGSMTSYQGDHIEVHGGNVGAIGDSNTVTMNIGNIPTDQATKDQLNQLIAQLKAELQKVQPANKNDAEAVGDLAAQALATVAKEQPNKTLVQITAEGLKKAAENIAGILPTVLPIATQIATTIMKVAGIPVPV